MSGHACTQQRAPGWENFEGLHHGILLRPALPAKGRLNIHKTIPALREQGLLPELSTYGCQQVHGANVIWIDEARQTHCKLGHGGKSVHRFVASDGLCSDLTGCLLTIQTADCLPVFLVDPVRRCCGVVHAGWRSLFQGIVSHAVRMLLYAGSQPADLRAWLAPCIRPPHYQVGQELVARFAEAFPQAHLDTASDQLPMPLVARAELLAAGLKESNIAESQGCTFIDAHAFHSYRREGENAGRMLSYIGWEK